MNKRTKPWIIASFVMAILITGLSVWLFKPVEFDQKIKYELELLKITVEKAEKENLILQDENESYKNIVDSLIVVNKKINSAYYREKKAYEKLRDRKPNDALLDSLLGARQRSD